MTAIRTSLRWLVVATAGAAATYAAMVAVTRYRYGKARRSSPGSDALLDRFMPSYEVVERHHIHVRAPAEMAFAAACDVDLRDSTLAAAIFEARAFVLGAHSSRGRARRGLLAEMKDLGWGVLAEVRGREIVVGAVTQPWAPNPLFKALPPAEFAAFAEPGYVKIAWTLRADPVTPRESIALTETRVITSDENARHAFRRYWSFVAPGVMLIRFLSLRLIKAEAERRVRAMEGTCIPHMQRRTS